MTIDSLHPSPLEQLDIPVAKSAGVLLYCKRDDQYSFFLGTALQGNKVRKLLPTLRAALAAHKKPLLYSFGGAYSNHVSALASAGEQFGLLVVLFIRGEEVDNPLLRDAAQKGAHLIKVSRSDYRLRNDPNWRVSWEQQLAEKYNLPEDQIWHIPEGGSTEAGVVSAGEAYTETAAQLGRPPDYFCLSAGTGGTAAGIIQAANPSSRIEVFPALKGSWMPEEINKFLPTGRTTNWTCIEGYHFGGYGKFPPAWDTEPGFLAKRADIGFAGLPPLEPIYTAKLFSGVLDRVGQGCYPPGSTVVVLHTGGLY